ncbi:choline kinase [Chromatiales bacterium (ex Bugula neritina AB1)]|nr:choline kinase [Chromatiales bacterium (ex Bugula neritina AB1)]
MKAENERIIRTLPCWHTTELQIEPLEGGITNHNYLVTDGESRYVVRLGDDIPVHQIKRFNEIAAATAAHAAGLSPAIIHHETGVLVMDYIASKALTAEQVGERETLRQIVSLVKKCHTRLPDHLRGASVVFWVFHVIRDYAATLHEGKSSHTALLPGLLETAKMLQEAGGPFDIIFGHNDLLPANILDDGQRLWLIDWEYGGYNTPLFDLGGLASNNELDENLERFMLEEYFEAPVSDDLWVRYNAMKCASLLRETLWSMVSEIHSTIDFDYSIYTSENLARFNRSLAEFKHLKHS